MKLQHELISLKLQLHEIFIYQNFFPGHPAGAPGSFLAAAAAQHSAMGLGPMPISGPSNAGAPKSLTAQPGVAPPAFRYT